MKIKLRLKEIVSQELCLVKIHGKTVQVIRKGSSITCYLDYVNLKRIPHYLERFEMDIEDFALAHWKGEKVRKEIMLDAA